MWWFLYFHVDSMFDAINEKNKPFYLNVALFFLCLCGCMYQHIVLFVSSPSHIASCYTTEWRRLNAHIELKKKPILLHCVYRNRPNRRGMNKQGQLIVIKPALENKRDENSTHSGNWLKKDVVAHKHSKLCATSIDYVNSCCANTKTKTFICQQ